MRPFDEESSWYQVLWDTRVLGIGREEYNYYPKISAHIIDHLAASILVSTHSCHPLVDKNEARFCGRAVVAGTTRRPRLEVPSTPLQFAHWTIFSFRSFLCFFVSFLQPCHESIRSGFCNFGTTSLLSIRQSRLEVPTAPLQSAYWTVLFLRYLL